MDNKICYLVFLLVFTPIILSDAHAQSMDDVSGLVEDGTNKFITELINNTEIKDNELVKEHIDPTDEEINQFKDDLIDLSLVGLDLFVKTEKVAESGANLVSKHTIPEILLKAIGIIIAGIIAFSILKKIIKHTIIVILVTLVIVFLLAYAGFAF